MGKLKINPLTVVCWIVMSALVCMFIYHMDDEKYLRMAEVNSTVTITEVHTAPQGNTKYVLRLVDPNTKGFKTLTLTGDNLSLANFKIGPLSVGDKGIKTDQGWTRVEEKNERSGK